MPASYQGIGTANTYRKKENKMAYMKPGNMPPVIDKDKAREFIDRFNEDISEKSKDAVRKAEKLFKGNPKRMTVKDALLKCDRKKIAELYLNKYGWLLGSVLEVDDEVTFGKYRDRIKKNVIDLIDRLCKMTPKPPEEELIFLAVHSVDDAFGDNISINLYRKKELLEEKEHYACYGYEFVPFEVTLDYEIANTYLTRYWLDDLLVEYLYEVSWTGWEQQHLEDELETLRERAQETEEHKDDPEYSISSEEFTEKLEEELGAELERPDPKQEEAWREFIRYQLDYCRTCERIEIEKWRKSQTK